MMDGKRSIWLALALWAILALPPVVGWLQSRMQLQLLVQIPLLVACGYWLRDAVPPGWQKAIAAWNPVGINGVIIASFVLAFWMLPRSMDAAVNDWRWASLKFITLPLLAGLPLGLSWPRMNFIVRGVVCMELIAMCLRLGLLYLVSPVRLCNSYLIDDQQLTGRWLLALGAVVLVWITLQLFIGHVSVPKAERASDGQKRLDTAVSGPRHARP